MDIKEIKNLVKSSKAVLVMENNEPSMVVMDYSTYQSLTNRDQAAKIEIKHPQQTELEILERINKEILALKDEIEREEKNLGVGLTD